MNTVTIIGGGLVGLLFAALLSRAKIPVTIIEIQEPLLHKDEIGFDARVSAINAVSQRLLENIGVWQLLRPKTFSPLRKLIVWDSLGGAEIEFDCATIGALALGAIVENREIIRVLWQQLQADENVTMITQVTPKELIQRTDHIEIILDNEEKILTRLVVGADGGKSWLRQQMHSEVVEQSYEQSAIVAVVKTQLPHLQTGWQAFFPAGVLALLPLSDSHHCAIVWSTPTARAHELMLIDENQFNDELNTAFGLRLGEIKRQSAAQAIPLIMRHAKHYVQSRLALIGDAAHTIHPLAGQGVNLGLMDAACLAQCIIDAQQEQRDFTSLRVLRRYERWRKGDNALMLLAMRGFKELFNTTSPLIVQARNVGLSVTNKLDVVKNYFMRLAIGESQDLPHVARKN
jgi:2-octaprenylphenol hydroxylase